VRQLLDNLHANNYEAPIQYIDMRRPFRNKRVSGPFIQLSSSVSNNNMFLEVVLDRDQSVSIMLDKKLYPNRLHKDRLNDGEDESVSHVGTQLAIDILSEAGVADIDVDPDKVDRMLTPVNDKLNRQIALVNGETLSIAYEVSTLTPDQLTDLIITVRQLDVTVNDIRWV